MSAKNLRWEDLRTILAIAVAGGLAGASKSLGLSHATVFRRLGDIENRLGVRLFWRNRSGYVPTAAGAELAATAHRIEEEVLDVERRLSGRDMKLSGTIRVTTTDTLLTGLLSSIFSDFRNVHPDINLEVIASNQLFNLSRRDADVALRPGRDPHESLIGRRIAKIEQSVYASINDESGNEWRDPKRHWVGPDAMLDYPLLEEWMSQFGFNNNCYYRTNTMLGMKAAIISGIGIGVLPCYLGNSDQGLCRLSGSVEELATDLWILTHPDMQRATRIRVFMEHVTTQVRHALPDAY